MSFVPQNMYRAMVLAAGLGTRMRPLTNDRPKALVEVAGRSLIDHNLDRLREAGVKRAIVNVHAFADLLEAHLKRRTDLEIIISDERALLMETGGGFKQARALLGDAPVFVCNIDSVWEEPAGSALRRLAQGFDASRMGARLMLADMDQCLGYDGHGDFAMDAEGELSFRGDSPRAPFAYMGAQIVNPAIIDGEPLEPFSFTRVWRRLSGEGRLHGAPLGGYLDACRRSGAPSEAAEARLKAPARAVAMKRICLTAWPARRAAPASAPFLDLLAERMIGALYEPNDPFALADALVLLPNRRAARGLMDAFAARLGGAALLPSIKPLGDLDDDPDVWGAEPIALDIPPAIAPVRQRLELAALIHAREKADRRR